MLRSGLMFTSKEKKWIVMSKDRKIIAKGNPRERYLVAVDNKKDRKRILFYNSERTATSSFRDYGFSISQLPKEVKSKIKDFRDIPLEAVPVEVTVIETEL